VQSSTEAIVAAFFGEGVVLNKNHTRLHKKENAAHVWELVD
jgi:hypothetical protein